MVSVIEMHFEKRSRLTFKWSRVWTYWEMFDLVKYIRTNLLIATIEKNLRGWFYFMKSVWHSCFMLPFDQYASEFYTTMFSLTPTQMANSIVSLDTIGILWKILAKEQKNQNCTILWLIWVYWVCWWYLLIMHFVEWSHKFYYRAESFLYDISLHFCKAFMKLMMVM